jgi:hypothetical protein
MALEMTRSRAKEIEMPDRGSRWLAAVVAAMLVAQPLALATDTAADDLSGAREQISRQLVELGRTPQSAQDAAGRLTPDDLAVLLAHPEMMQAAGDAQTHMAIGILLVVAIIIDLAAAGGSVVVISST